MGFYQDISTGYSEEVAQHLKKWSSQRGKLASAYNRRIFLLECKRQGIVPKHISSNINSIMGLFEISSSRKFNRKLDELNKNIRLKIIRLEIDYINYKIQFLEKSKRHIMNQLTSELPRIILDEFKRRQKVGFNKKFHKIRQSNLAKVERLHNTNLNRLVTHEKWFKNLSRVDIPNNVKTLLSLGSKFSLQISTKDIPVNKLIADVEDILQKTQNTNRDLLRSKIASIITNHIHNNKGAKTYTDRIYNETRSFLKNNENLLVLNSDKGSVTVIIERETYKQKMYEIVNSESFRTLQKDPTLTLQTKSNNYIKKLQDLNILSAERAKALKSYNSVCPKIYGNPKLHKRDCPLRPIVSSINSPTSNISMFMTEVLTQTYDRENEYFIKDTFEFATFVNNFRLEEDYVLISLDVVNLFGNLCEEVVVDVLNQRWGSISRNCDIPKDLFFEIIRFILRNNYFSFDNQFYIQIFGCAMGSKISPILAQYVMDHALDMCVPKLRHKIAFIKKFVDDLIVALHKQDVEIILEQFNSYNPHIQFTIEFEDENNSVSFLDTRLYRIDNTVHLDWHRKQTASDKLIHFKSDHPVQIKINCIKEMKNRVNKICHPRFLKRSIDKLFNIFVENGYPRKMISKLLYSSANVNHIDDNDRPPQVLRSTDTDGVEIKFGSIVNIKGLTCKIKKCLSREDVKIAVYNYKTVKRLYSRLKDTIPTMLHSNVIYRIQCEDCSRGYVGQTSQLLKNRISLHKSDINKKNKRCALTKHSLEQNHKFLFDNVEIIDKERNYNKRIILEMIHINEEEEAINSKSDTQNLSNIYTYLLTYPNREKNFYDGPIDE